MAGRFRELSGSDLNMKTKLGDRMIKQLLNSVIAKYRDLSVSRRSIICLSLRLRQIIDLLATDKSRYFAQPRPIIVNYWPNQKKQLFLLSLCEMLTVRTVKFHRLFHLIWLHLLTFQPVASNSVLRASWSRQSSSYPKSIENTSANQITLYLLKKVLTER